MTGRTLALTVALAASVTIATNTTHAQSEDAWEVRYPHIEFGIDAGYTFQGQFFLTNQSWLEPSVGFTYSFPAGYENQTSIKGY